MFKTRGFDIDYWLGVQLFVDCAFQGGGVVGEGRPFGVPSAPARARGRRKSTPRFGRSFSDSLTGGRGRNLGEGFGHGWHSVTY